MGNAAPRYTSYHEWQQFAPTVLGVDLEPWFALHPDGVGVCEAVEAILACEMSYELAEAYLTTEVATSSAAV